MALVSQGKIRRKEKEKRRNEILFSFDGEKEMEKK